MRTRARRAVSLSLVAGSQPPREREREKARRAAFFLAGLKATFPVVAVKNKHKQVVIAQPPDLHCNVDLGGGFLGEVQIILAYCLEIKHTIHAYYQLLRADAVDLVLEPHRGTSGEAVFDEFARMRELARARGLSASSGLAESTRSLGTT